MPTDAPASTTQRLIVMLAVSDIEAALKLYRDELGFSVTERFAKDGVIVWCKAKAGNHRSDVTAPPAPGRQEWGRRFLDPCERPRRSA